LSSSTSTLEYADDQTLSVKSLQDMLNFVVVNATLFGLRLSPKKYELICFHRPGTVDKAALPQIAVRGNTLKWKTVVYLGSRIAEDKNTVCAIKHHVCCAETVVQRLNNRVSSQICL